MCVRCVGDLGLGGCGVKWVCIMLGGMLGR